MMTTTVASDDFEQAGAADAFAEPLPFVVGSYLVPELGSSGLVA